MTGSGPGGQNVNKVATAVQLRVDAYRLGLSPPVFARLREVAGARLTAGGDILLAASEHRTQEANRAAVRDKLAALLDEALHRPAPRARTRLNRIGKTERLAGKKKRAAVKAGRGKVEW